MGVPRGLQLAPGWLRREMDVRLLTNRKLAELAGVSPFTVSQACNGGVSKESAEAILTALEAAPVRMRRVRGGYKPVERDPERDAAIAFGAEVALREGLL